MILHHDSPRNKVSFDSFLCDPGRNHLQRVWESKVAAESGLNRNTLKLKVNEQLSWCKGADVGFNDGNDCDSRLSSSVRWKNSTGEQRSTKTTGRVHCLLQLNLPCLRSWIKSPFAVRTSPTALNLPHYERQKGATKTFRQASVLHQSFCNHWHRFGSYSTISDETPSDEPSLSEIWENWPSPPSIHPRSHKKSKKRQKRAWSILFSRQISREVWFCSQVSFNT